MIDILLSTYNGEAFLKEQLDSILAQTATKWHLLIRDDGSTDSTLDIIRSYCSAHPEKIALLTDTGENLGPCQSYNILMQESEAPYVMFCDQDDVWNPIKVKTMLSAIKSAEKESQKGYPILLHSDLEVVDKNLRTISKSFIKHNHLDSETKDLLHLMIRNNVTACTVMCNRSLIDLATPIPATAIMHDWWLAIIASAIGKIEFISTPLVKYRQHPRNYYGAGVWKNTVGKFFNPGRYRKNLTDISKQIQIFQTLFEDKLSDSTPKGPIAAFSKLHDMPFFQKRRNILKYGRGFQSFSKNMIMLLLG